MMQFLSVVLFTAVVVVAILIKENFCVPAIRPLSQRGIIFPVEDWDNCRLDDVPARPGLCKKLEECPDILRKWDEQNVYPKTCYFVKKQQFVCCPIPAAGSGQPDNVSNATEPSLNNLLDIFNTEPGTTTYRPSNIFLDRVANRTTTTVKPSMAVLDTTATKSTKKPSNIVVDNFKGTATTTTTKKPINIFLDNSSTHKTTSEQQPFDDIFEIEHDIKKLRSEAECDLQNAPNFDIRKGPPSRANEFPFMAVLGWRSEIDNEAWYPCGGILISRRFVLTAAHCANIGGISPSFVHVGDKNLTQTEDEQEGTVRIKRFIVHPDYNETAINDDIALVELEQEVNSVAACLWTLDNLPIAKLIALGYGRITTAASSTSQLFKTFLTFIDNAECQEIYKFDEKFRNIRIAQSHLCAGDVEHFRHFCQGDSGGPLIVQVAQINYVVGITAFGLGCADLPPSIFTRVSSFIGWIESIVWPEIDVRIEDKYK